MRKILAFSLILTFSPILFAGVQKNAQVEGTIDFVNSAEVTIITESGQKIVVPRSSIPKHYSLSPASKVIAYVPSSKFTNKKAGK